MDFLKSGLKTVLGSQDPSQQPTGAEIIERLVERIHSSTLLDDRRDACRAIKALSRKHRVDVGAQGMDALVTVLNTDKQDCELVGYTLDTLCNIMSPDVFEEEECAEGTPDALLHIGEQFTEMFIKHPENVSIILSFLEEYDFKVRWPALKLLSTMLTNRSRDIQEIILVSPMGVSRLMDLLGDTREIIRNDVLLLLIQLTKGHANLQKIVAFENAFDKIFDVICEEGCSDGGIVVEDCLLLMLNLLKNNTSNQNFFKEGSYIMKLGPMFQLFSETQEELVWPEQKVANLIRTLQVIRCLVSPSNPGQVSQSCQDSLFTSAIFQALCNILMLYGVPARFLTEVITTLAEVIRGNMKNQQHFSTVMAPSVPPREIIVVLLTSMVNEKNNLDLRCSCLYCFECYLFKNEIIQAEIIQTLLPSSTDVSKLTCGQLLCTGMFSLDSLSNWLSAVALSYALIENPVQKENLLRAQLAPDINSSPVSLIAQVVILLQQCNKVQGKLGFLILLSSWLTHCQLAVKQFLEIPSAVSYLTTQACSMDRDDSEELVQGLSAFLLGICILFNDGSVPAYTKDALVHLVANRVGEEVFLAKLSEVSRSEQYSRASKSPQLIVNSLDDLMLDYEFCKLFKALESMVIKAVIHKSIEVNGDSDVIEFKEMIREQDRKITELTRQKLELETTLKQTSENLLRLTDENTLLRAQINAGVVFDNDELNQQIYTLKTECNTKDSVIRDLGLRIENLTINKNFTTKENELQQEIKRLGQDHEDLLVLLADKDEKLANMEKKLESLGIKIDDADETKPESEATIIV